MRHLAVFIASCVTMLAQSNSVRSLAYGPASFPVPKKTEAVQTAQFTVPALVDPPFTMVVATGDPGIQFKQLDNATIKVNGTIIFGLTDLQGKSPVEKPVKLFVDPSKPDQQNTLEVEISARHEASLIIAIAGYSYAFAADYASIPLVGAAAEPTLNSTSSAPFSSGILGPGHPHWPPPLIFDVDWRTKGAVSPVENEGTCPADWAFSATGAVEGAVFINTGNLTRLSEQQLLDCVPNVSSCAQGSPAGALQYLLQASNTGGGAISDADYPYTGVIGTCRANSSVPAGRISSVSRLTPGSEGELQSAVNFQPVSVVLNGNWFSTYIPQGIPLKPPGIADPPCDDAPPQYRAALVIGYDSQSWWVKNSLGTGWGREGGYFFLLRGKNKCGIANYAIVPK